MSVKPPCGDLEIPKSRRQGEEHKAKAILPEPQTHTGGSHSLPTPDKEQAPHDTRSVRLNERPQPGDGASNKLDNGRTGAYVLTIITTYIPRDRLNRRQLLHGDGASILPNVPGQRPVQPTFGPDMWMA